MRYWLMKTEPGTFSLDDLRNAPDGTAPWDGVRNYQARNHMRDGMRLGDAVLIYHSSTEHRAIAGLARVAREAYPDHTAWDPGSDHYDPRSTREHPVWLMVDVRFLEAFRRPLPLDALRAVPGLAGMMLLRKGMRLSIQPVTPEEYSLVCAYGRGERALLELPATPPPAARPKAKPPARAALPAKRRTAGAKRRTASAKRGETDRSAQSAQAGKPAPTRTSAKRGGAPKGRKARPGR